MRTTPFLQGTRGPQGPCFFLCVLSTLRQPPALDERRFSSSPPQRECVLFKRCGQGAHTRYPEKRSFPPERPRLAAPRAAPRAAGQARQTGLPHSDRTPAQRIQAGACYTSEPVQTPVTGCHEHQYDQRHHHFLMNTQASGGTARPLFLAHHRHDNLLVSEKTQNRSSAPLVAATPHSLHKLPFPVPCYERNGPGTLHMGCPQMVGEDFTGPQAGGQDERRMHSQTAGILCPARRRCCRAKHRAL